MKPRKIAQTQTMLAVIDTVCRDIVASITVLRDSLGQCHAGLSDGHHTAQKNSPHRFSRRFGGTDGATVHSAAAGRGGQRGAKDAAGGVPAADEGAPWAVAGGVLRARGGAADEGRRHLPQHHAGAVWVPYPDTRRRT